MDNPMTPERARQDLDKINQTLDRAKDMDGESLLLYPHIAMPFIYTLIRIKINQYRVRLYLWLMK